MSSSPPLETRPYGQISSSERLHLLAISIASGLNTVKTFASYIFSPERKYKTWKRFRGEAGGRYMSERLSIPELQHGRPSTYVSYDQFIQETGLESDVEILEPAADGAKRDMTATSAKLLWVGRKRHDRVILYLHGGGYVMAMNKASLYFWRHIQQELDTRGLLAGIAVLNYTIYPDGPFPTVLSEVVLAVNHLLASGVNPQNLYLAGDSAGGNAVMQLVSHILHPEIVKPVPPVATMSTAFAGAVLISPWIVLTTDAPSYAENEDADAIARDALGRWGAAVLQQAPDEYLSFVEPGKAPQGWFDSIGTIFKRLFITAGEKECMRDDIDALAGVLKGHYNETHKGGSMPVGTEEKPPRDNSEVTFLLEKGGVHDHSLVDFEVGETKLVETTRIIVDWLVEGMVASDGAREKGK